MPQSRHTPSELILAIAPALGVFGVDVEDDVVGGALDGLSLAIGLRLLEGGQGAVEDRVVVGVGGRGQAQRLEALHVGGTDGVQQAPELRRVGATAVVLPAEDERLRPQAQVVRHGLHRQAGAGPQSGKVGAECHEGSMFTVGAYGTPSTHSAQASRRARALENVMDPLRAQLRRLREAAGMTQRQLAAAMGMAPTTIQAYEDGRVDIPLSRLRLFAQHLGLTLEVHFRPADPDGSVENLTEAQAFLLDLVHRKIRRLGDGEVSILAGLLDRLDR